MTAGIYRLDVGDQFYIGAAINIEVRCRNHLARLRSGRHDNSILQEAYNLAGDAVSSIIIVVRDPWKIQAAESAELATHEGDPRCLNILFKSTYRVPYRALVTDVW